MALLALWTSNPDAVTSLTIEQVVATAGDGKLRDDSECSRELRDFLSQVGSEKLAEYADYCLMSTFQKSGLVLQDVVNELGRRLDYSVTNGRYQGTVNAIGNDGLWRSPDGHDLLVEVKTTDAYRISLDTIAEYRNRLRDGGKIGLSHSMLIVVGREDTGELEAQVRGSQHAWDMRLISVDALVRLVNLKESTEASATGAKIRGVLVPMEYTRLDSLIDVLFTAAKDAETAADSTAPVSSDDEGESAWEITSPQVMQAKRDQIVSVFARGNAVKLVRKSRALYWDATHSFRVACAVSKRYTKKGVPPYWYACYRAWDQFLGEANIAHLVLGCMDLGLAFALPLDVLQSHLAEMNTTTRTDGTSYWHLKILEPKPRSYALQMPKSGKHVSLEAFAFSLE